MQLGMNMKIGVVGAAVLGVIFFVYQTQVADVPRNLRNINSVEDAIRLFPKTVDEIEKRVQAYMQDTRDVINAVIAIPDEKRTYANTMQPLDEIAVSDLHIMIGVSEAIKHTNVDDEVRQAGEKAYSDVKQFFIDEYDSNVALYKAVQTYAGMHKEQLSAQQERFVQETLKDFKRAGLDLPEEQLQRVVQLKKDIIALRTEFESNIATDNRTVTATREQLAGVPDDFIGSLKQSEDGLYVLAMDYPTRSMIMTDCAVGDTRKRFAQAFGNRGYPANKRVLGEMIAKRDALAKLLNFESYAAYELADQMVGSLERAENFIDDLIEKSRVKEQQEFERLVADLPSSVAVRPDGKFNSWDLGFANKYYKKKHFNVDEQEIANYFPMEHTLRGLLHIYEQFLNLKVIQVPVSGTWHEEVRLLEVRNATDNKVRGYVFLDLYPRPNKYTHACDVPVLTSVQRSDSSYTPALAVVVANFPKSTATRPSLLKRNNVRTFFHEFGHALHDILGGTQVASLAGTQVKVDFVEMPSQMLEEWLWDKDILKHLSSHYQTGESLPDELIDTLLALRQFNTGMWVQGQGLCSLLALAYFKEGANKDLDAITRELYERISVHSAFDPEKHLYASFGHLGEYGSRYYGYLWSRVFAHDLFEEIKKYGLLNPEIGRKYVQEVIGKGGSEDPNTLLVNFLGREPNQEAFLKNLGL